MEYITSSHFIRSTIKCDVSSNELHAPFSIATKTNGLSIQISQRPLFQCLFGYVFLGQWGSCTVVVKCYHIYSLKRKVSFQNPRIELPHEDPIAEINLLQRLSENQHARHICPALLGVFESPSGWLFAVSENCGNDLTFVAPSKQAYARTIMHSVVRHCLVLKQQCGLSHSDLSLENICLKDGDNVKLIDFGLAAPALKSTTRRSGKLMYMAPEIFQAETYYPAEADVWALGVCLFLITYGQPPQKSVNGPWWLTFLEQAQDYQTKAPSLLHSLMACMLTAKPSERIPLEQILSHPWFL